jgi:hypothetical protein
MIYQIYYNNTFTIPLTPVPEVCQKKNYRMIYQVEANDLEEVFHKMNTLPASAMLRSMCSGDIVVDENGTAYYCKSFGWQAVRFE